MGVQGLWDLVAPAGRRVKINSLEGKVLAIDVSIWVIRMLHGSVSLGKNEFKNIHLVGILRRIIKLLFYGIKPVFVFDGKFPELKRETVKQRQMMRENRKRNLKKIAEKYLTKVLEERIKETIGRMAPSKKGKTGSDNKPPLDFEDEERYLEDEEEKQERQRREKDKREQEEAEEAGQQDAMLYDFEFDMIVEENKELLIESGIDMDEFNKLETAKQYDTVKKVRNKMRDRKLKKYYAIDDLGEFSKVHVNDYVRHVKRKHKVEKSKEEANAKRMSEEQDNILGNIKYGDVTKNEYMRNLFLDPQKNVMQKTLVSDRSKGFIYMVQKDKKLDNPVLKLGNKKQSKFERLKKLNNKLREIAQNAESLPTFFSYEELLCDNPLDAFKHHIQKEDPIPVRNNLENDENEDTNQAELNDTSRQQIDVDEVFGFDDWDNNQSREPSIKRDNYSEKHSDVEEDGRQRQNDIEEELEKEQGRRQEHLPPVVEHGVEDEEDLFDLFEYKGEQYEEEKTEVKISPKATQYKPAFIENNNKYVSGEKGKIFEDVNIEKIYDIANDNKWKKEDSSMLNLRQSMPAESDSTIASKAWRKGDESPDIAKRVQVKPNKQKNSVNKAVDVMEKQSELSMSNIIESKTMKEMSKKDIEEDKMRTPDDKGARTDSTKNTVLKFSAESGISSREDVSTTKKSFFGRLKYPDEGKSSPSQQQEKPSHLSLIQELTWDENPQKKKSGVDQDKKDKKMMMGIDAMESETKEEEETNTNKATFFKKAVVEDACVLDKNADLFWKRNSIKEDSNRNREKNIEVKDEGVKLEVKNEEIVEIQYEKTEYKEKSNIKEDNKEEDSLTTPLKQGTTELNQDSNKFSVMSQDYEDMDEAKLLEQMKELEENETLDKWALMEQFQKFQNLSELEGDSIQEKLREIKELLLMFGVPWVESPAEAEAQCAFLELSGLVDGVVTDDSDVFLFGSRHVYRNIFDKGDFVYSYPMKYVENELALDRSKLILMALFLGSDYTLGIKGVGIVNAMEIVRAFDTPEALERFKEWAQLPDVLMEDASTHYKNIPEKELQYKLYHRNFKKHWELPDNFPDKRVVEAYEKPSVDPSQEKFQWGTPDVENLEGLCRNRFKWDQERINNALDPLKRAMKERTGQKRITDFFREEKIAVINSKRINQSIAALQDKDKKAEGEDPASFTEDVQKKIEAQLNYNLKKRRQEEEAAAAVEGELEEFAFKKRTKKTNFK